MRSTARHIFPITLCMAMAMLLNGCSLLAQPSASPQLTVATPDPRHASAEQQRQSIQRVYNKNTTSTKRIVTKRQSQLGPINSQSIQQRVSQQH